MNPSMPPSSSGGTGIVLAVDDDPMTLRAIVRTFAESEYTIEACRTAAEAVERVARGGVEAVLSDISMPKMSGLELLKILRTHDTDLPVVLLTGLPALESAVQAIELGAYKYVLKPFDPNALRQTVTQAVRVYRLTQAKRRALALLGMDGDGAGIDLQTSFEQVLQSLWIAYQPIVRAGDGSIFGYEALLRSDVPQLPGPGHVLEAAERLGELVRLGRTIRTRAAEPVRNTPEPWALFVNLHPQDLDDPDLVSRASALAGIADRVVFEITERASLGNVDNARATIASMRELGFRIAVDDLGAGYAGLTSFAMLEPEIVKLDMTLIRDVDTSPVKQKLVRSMTTLCRDMGINIVAEGVETREERDTLTDLGCDLLQGYFFARPGRPFPLVAS
jgi:EAL domain-containing protein (putative c-di-GMP-specific phosphodiesterase class I)